MRTAAAAVLLFLASLPVTAALLPGPERPLTAPEVGVAAGYLEVRDVVARGTDFLVLWSDFSPSREGIYASIVSDSGVARRVAVSPLVRGGALAHALAAENSYLVFVSQAGGVVRLFRLDSDGQLTGGPTPLHVGNGYVTALVQIGSRVLAVLSSESGLSGVLMDGNGRVLSQFGIATPRGPGRITATSAGDDFVVAWSEEIKGQEGAQPPLTAVNVVRVSWNGVVGQPGELMAPEHAYVSLASAVSRTGAGLSVRTQSPSGNALHNFTLGSSHDPVEAHPVVAISLMASGVQVVPVSDGFVAAYTDYVPGEAYPSLVRVPFGSTSSHWIAMGRVNREGLRIETNGSTALAVFSGAPVAGTALDAEVTHRTSDIAPVSLSWVQQAGPLLAPGGSRMLAAWVEPRDPWYATLLVQLRDAEGNAIDAEPIVVAEGVAGQPAIVFTGQVWLVAWADRSGMDAHVLVRRVSADGVLLDEPPIDAGKGWAPALASNGTVAVLATDESRAAAIHVTRFSRAGILLDQAAVTSETPGKTDPSIATNGEEFLVTWTESYQNVSGQRLAANGTAMDAAPIAIAHGPLSEASSRIASDGTDFVVAYAQFHPLPRVDPPLGDPPPALSEVRTKRILKNGVLADTTAEQDGSLLGPGTLPQITPFLDGYVASFIEDLYPFTRLTVSVVPLNASGAREALPRAVVRHAEGYSEIHAIQAIGNTIHVAYTRVAPELGFVQRIYLRSLTDQAVRRRSSRR